ncbi:MAG: FtsX-like permease family protein [Candidatus Neomarinimicrobiota bacterium]
MLFKLALRNLLGAGLRTWLNVFVTSLSFVMIIFTSGMYKGMIEYSRRIIIRIEIAGGAYWHPEYDPKDPLTLDDSHASVPPPVAQQVALGVAAPVLVIQGSAYPDGRMVPLIIRGIPPDQQAVELPTAALDGYAGTAIPVLIGAGMAGTMQVEQGDVFVLRWRDAAGTYDAYEAEVVTIMNTDNFNVDRGQLWVPLSRLRRMAGMAGQATYVVLNTGAEVLADPGGWPTRDIDYLSRDIVAAVQADQAYARSLYGILLALAGMGIFNSQVLSIFRRRKEIGTLMALGMARNRIITLFTTEGGFHSLLALAMGALYGGPLLWFTATSGIPLPYDAAAVGFVIGKRLLPVYPLALLIGTMLLVTVVVTVVSYLPARRIAKMKPTEALTGRIN